MIVPTMSPCNSSYYPLNGRYKGLKRCWQSNDSAKTPVVPHVRQDSSQCSRRSAVHSPLFQPQPITDTLHPKDNHTRSQTRPLNPPIQVRKLVCSSNTVRMRSPLSRPSRQLSISSSTHEQTSTDLSKLQMQSW